MDAPTFSRRDSFKASLLGTAAVVLPFLSRLSANDAPPPASASRRRPR